MNKILLVDDHEIVAEGIKLVLEKNKTMGVDIITDSREVKNRIDQEEYDAVLMNLHMPYLNGLELSKQILKEDAARKILIFADEKDIHAYFNLLVEAGVCGFINKTASPKRVFFAIECAIQGETVLPASLLRQLRKTEDNTDPPAPSRKLKEVTLTEREQRIIVYISEGLTNREIANKLLVCQRSVEYTLTGIFKKLHVKSRAGALAEASRKSLITHYSM
ncbi:response regulator transcription factor [Salibacterium aidingense]|uniref:response regulator transcription factor n=1 Tax=Salibacterium aidingense TaxID=384933 RepID=UPI0004147CCF|nr:response regulator transcription factor [Salibacterium aidingense]